MSKPVALGAGLGALALALLLPVSTVAHVVGVRLLSARTHVDGSFVTNQAIYADAHFIYLASYQGKLFVVARDRAADFPVVEVVQSSAAPLTAVRGDRTHLYVTSADGRLLVYRKAQPLAFVGWTALAKLQLGSLSVGDRTLYVATGSARLAADSRRLFVSALNEGDTGVEIDKNTMARGWVGQPREPNQTSVFDRANGLQLSGLANPPVIRGSTGAANLYVDDTILAQTIPGCCGAGIFIRDPKTLELVQVIERRFTNTVVRRGQWLIGATEAGHVDVFDLAQTPARLEATADLRRLTGHTGEEDIELRALWTDDHDTLVFAGSSWGNDSSRGSSLPSFFVLELEEPQAARR